MKNFNFIFYSILSISIIKITKQYQPVMTEMCYTESFKQKIGREMNKKFLEDACLSCKE